MKVHRSSWILLVVVVSLLSLMSCRPIEYYMAKVYKVHGTATVAGTNPPTPVGSVEVVARDYQYSQLTNYYGDYEMELTEGTWTINFRKEGFEPFSDEVTVGPENPRERLDAALVMEEPQTSVTLTGLWYLTIQTPYGEEGPLFLHLAQDGTVVTGTYGITGTLIDSEVTLLLDLDGPLTFTGQFAGDEIVGTWSEDGVNYYPWNMVRADVTFGTLTMQGSVDGQVVDIQTDKALGIKGPIYPASIVRFETDHPWIGTFEIRSWNQPDFVVGSDYPVSNFLKEDRKVGVFHEIISGHDGPDGPSNSYGMLTIDAYQPDSRISGSFVHDDGRSLMAFDLNIGGSGTAFIENWANDAGTYNCTNIQQYSATYNEVGVLYREADVDLFFLMSNGQNLSAPTTYDTFMEDMNLSSGIHFMFGDEMEDGPFHDYPGAQSGELTLSRYDSNGMAGSFDVDIVSEEGGSSGSVSGSFDVTFEVQEL